MRNAFAQQITKLAAQNKKIILLSGDIGNRLFDKFKIKCKNQFYNCGVAENNMVGVAAGLAKQGFIPFVYTIAPFLVARSYEQIKLDVCYQNLNVKIVGTGAGQSVVKTLATKPWGVSSYFVSMVHNAYLATAIERGVPSLIFLSMFIYYMLKLLKRSYRRSKRKDDKMVVLATMAVCFACLFNGLFQPMFQLRLLMLAILIGYIPNEKNK